MIVRDWLRSLRAQMGFVECRSARRRRAMRTARLEMLERRELLAAFSINDVSKLESADPTFVFQVTRDEASQSATV